MRRILERLRFRLQPEPAPLLLPYVAPEPVVPVDEFAAARREAIERADAQDKLNESYREALTLVCEMWAWVRETRDTERNAFYVNATFGANAAGEAALLRDRLEAIVVKAQSARTGIPAFLLPLMPLEREPIPPEPDEPEPDPEPGPPAPVERPGSQFWRRSATG